MKRMIKLFSILGTILVALMVCIFVIVLSHSNIRETSPRLFMNMVVISFLFNTCAIVMELVALIMKKKHLGSYAGSKDGFIFLLFTVITIILWFAHFFEFAGFIEKQGYEISSHPIWQVFAPLVLIGVFLMPFLCLAIVVLAVSSFREHLRHNKIIEDRWILREIAAVLAGVSIMIGLTIVLPSVVGVGAIIAQLVRWCLPSFVGGMAAGYVAQRKGWLFGLLVIIIPMVFSLLYFLLAYYWEVPGVESIYNWIKYWWLVLLALVAGSSGGWLGEVLYKTTHKQKRLAK